MKKVISLILCSVLIFGLTGCNKKSNEEKENKPKTPDLVTTKITTTTTSFDIEDGSIEIPVINRTILNKDTNETKSEVIDISKLKFINSKNEELKVENGRIILENIDDTITIEYEDSGKVFKTSISVYAEKDYITIDKMTIYYGKYKAEGDLPSNFDGIITINKDKTATYTGSKYSSNSSKINKVNLTGTWELKANSIGGLVGHPDDFEKVDGIFFTWSDGSNNAYGLSDKYFGNQFMGYRWISK